MAKHADTYRSIENLFDGVTYQALEIEPGRVSITTHKRRRMVLGLPRPAHGGPLSTGRDIPEPLPLDKWNGAGNNVFGSALDTIRSVIEAEIVMTEADYQRAAGNPIFRHVNAPCTLEPLTDEKDDHA